MPVRPDELELKIGDRVEVPDLCETGVVVTLPTPGEHMYIVDSDSSGSFYLGSRDMVRICNNCDMTYEDHAEGGKCLYAPTKWS